MHHWKNETSEELAMVSFLRSGRARLGTHTCGKVKSASSWHQSMFAAQVLACIMISGSSIFLIRFGHRATSIANAIVEIKSDPGTYPRFGGPNGGMHITGTRNDSNYNAVVSQSRALLIGGSISLAFFFFTLFGTYAFLTFIVPANSYSLNTLAKFPLQALFMKEFLADLSESLCGKREGTSVKTKYLFTMPSETGYSGTIFTDTLADTLADSVVSPEEKYDVGTRLSYYDYDTQYESKYDAYD